MREGIKTTLSSHTTNLNEPSTAHITIIGATLFEDMFAMQFTVMLTTAASLINTSHIIQFCF